MWIVDACIVPFLPLLLPLNRFGLVVLCVVALSACSGAPSGPFAPSSAAQGYWLPLSVNAQFDHSVTEAVLDYQDACRQQRTLPIADGLQESLTREIGTVFVHVRPAASPTPQKPDEGQVDGTVEVTLGLKELELLIPKHDTNTYAATVTLGATVRYIDAGGTVLYSKSLRTSARGEVETDQQDCQVTGLAGVAQQAIIALAQGIKKHLGTSVKIQQAAEARAPGGPAEPTVLKFRALFRDKDQNRVLTGGEQVTIEAEVMNVGTETMKGVVISLDGSPTLIQVFPNPIPVGDLTPGETRRVEVHGTLPAPIATEQAELLLSVLTADVGAGEVGHKKFVVQMRPADPQSRTDPPDDVDVLPRRIPGYERRKVVGLAIGVGAFRDHRVPEVKFAARDAAVMAWHWGRVGGIPAGRVKVATDRHARKKDFANLIEGWLPRQAKAGGTVFAFVSGRAWVDPSTGAIWLLPYEGVPGSLSSLFPLRRLHTALARLPAERVVLFLDLVLTLDGPKSGRNAKGPVWSPPALAGGKFVQLTGSSGAQQAHRFEAGRHGLFTYFLLKGLRGAADQDANGVVGIGELFEYVRVQVPQVAQAEFGNRQEPMSLPPLVPGAKGWGFPLTRTR